LGNVQRRRKRCKGSALTFPLDSTMGLYMMELKERPYRKTLKDGCHGKGRDCRRG
jgi:hypothetical protein